MFPFKPKQTPILGIDISSISVKLLELSRTGSGFRVERHAVEPLPSEAVAEKVIQDVEAVGEAIRSAVKKAGTRVKDAAVAVPGSAVIFQVASSSGATSVSFKKAVLSLTVTPQITPDDRVNMDLAITRDSVGQIFAGVPSIDTRELQTQVLVDNGETVVLGGIYEHDKSNTVNRVPFFSDLPVVGDLFKSTIRSNNKSELPVFVTPKSVKGQADLDY